MNAILPLLMLPAALGQAPAPLACAAPTVERGEVRTGPVLKQAFELKNTGPAPIQIDGAQIGCGCGRFDLSAKAVPPGGAATFTLMLNTLTLPAGPNQWAATVQYRVGEAKHELTVRLKATIVPEISVDPPVIAATAAGAFTQVVTVTDRRANPARVTKAASTNPHFTLTVAPPADANGVRTQKVTLAVLASLPPGFVEDTLMLTTTDPACPELRVPVKVTKPDPTAIQVSPAAPAVAFAEGASEASVRVALRMGGATFTVEKAETAAAGVKVFFSEGAGEMATVRVVVNAKEAVATGKAEVVVTLAEPRGKTVTIPVTW